MNRIAAGRPRVIRRIIALHKTGTLKGQPKIVWDHRTRYSIERIAAQRDRRCTGCGGGIWIGDRFALVTNLDDKRWLGGRSIPNPKDYHFRCVPEGGRALVRFFIR